MKFIVSFPTSAVMRVLLISSIVSVAFHCHQESQVKEVPINKNAINNSLVEFNKSITVRENDELDQYAKRQNWDMVKTGTGLRYLIYSKGSGQRASSGMRAKVKYSMRLLDGTLCYDSEKRGPRDFVVSGDGVESGLHEAIHFLRVGDKAIVLMPSYLAHGLLGDNDKIPPRASLVFDVEVISLQ